MSKIWTLKKTDANLPKGCVRNVQNLDAKLHHTTSSTTKLDFLIHMSYLIIQWNGENSAVIMTGGYEKTFDGIVEI